ncbi:MAG: hypothetical protein LBT05_10690 [Planctomycetaceae bacterium]|jgi:hypothetical protein|nr:hypothetical protein [Planctomycetaceae bacterium]
MKQTARTIFFIAAAMALAVGEPQFAFADLNASQIVSHFNSLNNGVGIKFNFSSSGREVVLSKPQETNHFADLGAYSSSASTATSFHTFCVEPDAPTDPSGNSAILNDDPVTGISKKIPTNKTLSLGAAVLYTEICD